MRTVAVWTHASRTDASQAAARFISALAERGIRSLCSPDDHDELACAAVDIPDHDILDDGSQAELCVIFGGDGSILRAAEWALPRGVPVLGVNMGHVGFLAELEHSDLEHLVDKVVDRAYEIDERTTLAVRALNPAGDVVWESEAINEVSIEKSARERMLDVVVRIDERPLSRWGCDGVLVATPTGSTAYAFSAGGPVIWPDVEAMLVVPISAHALFSRPIVISPSSRVDVQLVEAAAGEGVVWCDGRRSTSLDAGTTIRVVQGERRLRLARLAAQPFTNRLVKKFGLRVEGWRGANDHAN